MNADTRPFISYSTEAAARAIVDALEATIMQLQEERWFESERERRFFSRLAALLRHHVNRELEWEDTGAGILGDLNQGSMSTG